VGACQENLGGEREAGGGKMRPAGKIEWGKNKACRSQVFYDASRDSGGSAAKNQPQNKKHRPYGKPLRGKGRMADEGRKRSIVLEMLEVG